MLTVLPAVLRPFAKSITPAVLGVLAALIALLAGVGDKSALEVALVALAASALAYVVANAPEGLARFAKALTPALLTVVGVGATWAATGSWDRAEWSIALAGLGSSLVTYLVPNATGIAAGTGSLVAKGYGKQTESTGA
jgi:hypothetical protein